MNETEKKIAELKLQRAQIRASKDLQAGLIAEARKAEYESPTGKDVKAAAQHSSKLEHEMKDLREQEDFIDCDIAELMEEIREEKRDARHAKRQLKAEKSLDRDLDLMVSSIDKVITAFEKIVDDKNAAERVGALMAKVAGVATSTMAKCEKAAKEAVEKPTPAMSVV
jgi:hypothetical protein